MDADWDTTAANRSSYTGYAFLLSGAAIFWQSHKWRLAALSTTEADNMAISVAAKEAVYVRRFLTEISI